MINWRNKEISLDEHPVILFNYGLVCNMGHYQHQIDFFNKLNYPIILHDYRGHYSSTSDKDYRDCNFLRFSKDLKLLLEQLEVQQAVMIGHSMGVNATLEFALHYPKLLKAQVLISGSTSPPQEVMFDSNLMELVVSLAKVWNKANPENFRKIWQSSGLNPLGAKLIHLAGFNAKQVPMEFIHHYLNHIGRLPPGLFFQLFDQMGTQHIENKLSQIDCPTLIIGGLKDMIIPSYLQLELHKKIKNSELYLMKNGSHVPQMDFPQFINSRLHLFLQSLQKH